MVETACTAVAEGNATLEAARPGTDSYTRAYLRNGTSTQNTGRKRPSRKKTDPLNNDRMAGRRNVFEHMKKPAEQLPPFEQTPVRNRSYNNRSSKRTCMDIKLRRGRKKPFTGIQVVRDHRLRLFRRGNLLFAIAHAIGGIPITGSRIS